MSDEHFEDHQKILKLIRIIRESFSQAEEVYMTGSCIRFALILDAVFPGQILYDQDHAIFEMHGRCYDIRGEVEKSPHYIPIVKYGVGKLYELFQLRYKP